jgi:hypothetical protein
MESLNSISSVPNCLQSRIWGREDLLKITLLALTIFNILGAVISNFCVLGMPGVIAFSFSGGCFAALLAVVQFTKKKFAKENSSANAENTGPSSKNFTISELVQRLHPINFEPIFDLKKIEQHDSIEEEQAAIHSALIKKMNSMLGLISSEATSEDFQAFQAIFASAKKSHDKLETLSWLFFLTKDLRFLLKLQILENLDWPSEEIKNSILSRQIALHLLINTNSIEKSETYFENSQTYEILVHIDKILDAGDQEIKIPISLPMGIGVALFLEKEANFKNLKEKGSVNPNSLQFVIRFFEENGAFKVGDLEPMMPFLKKIPGEILLRFDGKGSEIGERIFRNFDM